MKKVELLAPAGNYEAFLGAINAGADAVYLGGEKYGARAYADNFTEEEIISAIRYAHVLSKKVYLTINTLMKEDELIVLYDYVKPLYESGLDGVIVQDLGAFFLLKESFPKMELHASTQMTLTSDLGIAYMKEIGASRVVPARELSLSEIQEIKKNVDIEIECFVHGAMCYCYSGQCLFSSILGGRSGNRGRCAQPCRLPYKIGKNANESYPFSLKDMCTINYIPKLIEAGIDSFKIEGRMKKPEYAAGVTAIYRKYIDLYYEKGADNFKVSKEDINKLSQLYIRSEIQDGYYFRHNGKEMITPGKPSYSGSDETYLNYIRETYIDKSKKIPIELFGQFKAGEKAVLSAKWQDVYVTLEGEIVDVAKNRPMTKEDIQKQLLKLGNTIFECCSLQIDLGPDVFIPNKTLNELRRNVLWLMENEIISRNGFDMSRIDAVKNPIIKTDKKKNSATKKEYVISVTTKQQLEMIKNRNYSYKRVYLDYQLVLELEKDELDELGNSWEIGVIYPRIVRKNAKKVLDEIFDKSSSFPYALIKNLETLAYLKKQNYEGKLIADYTLYICNSKSANWAQSVVDGLCYPVELNRNELTQIDVSDSIIKEQLVYAYLPLMVTANCIKKTTDRCGQSNATEIIYDRYQKAFTSKSNCRLCYSEIYNCVPLSLHKYLDDMKHQRDAYRIDFTIEDSKSTGKVLDLFFDRNNTTDLSEYTTGHYKRGVE